MATPVIIATANEDWNLLNFRSGVIRAFIDDGFQVVAAAPSQPQIAERLRQLGCVCEPIPIDPAGLRPWQEMQTVLAYRRLIARYRPAAIISWTIKANIYAAMAAGSSSVVSLPNVSGLGTAFMQRGLLRNIARQMYRNAFRRADTVFFQNEDDLTWLSEDGLVQEHKAVVLPGSGVDTAWFAPTSAERPMPGHFLMLSRLIADKGVREFVAAARAARELYPDLRFTLMGQVNVANRTAIAPEELQSWIKEGVIEYRPPVEDVRHIISSADFVVLPSYREGMSRVLIEAAAMARPSITCDVPGCRDIVEDGRNGYLCAPRDAKSLMEAILRAVATDDVTWSAMSQRARAVATERFSEEVVVGAYRDALRRSGVEL